MGQEAWEHPSLTTASQPFLALSFQKSLWLCSASKYDSFVFVACLFLINLCAAARACSGNHNLLTDKVSSFQFSAPPWPKFEDRYPPHIKVFHGARDSSLAERKQALSQHIVVPIMTKITNSKKLRSTTPLFPAGLPNTPPQCASDHFGSC